MTEQLSPEQQRELVAKYQSLREQVDDLYSKLGQVENDRAEHEYVVVAPLLLFDFFS